MVLWKEYQRIKSLDTWTDNDVRILLNFCWEIQVVQYEISEELKKALGQLDSLHKRVEFYRSIHPLKALK